MGCGASSKKYESQEPIVDADDNVATKGISGEINLGLSGSFAHSLSAVVTWPPADKYPAKRSWILILGQQDSGAVHWLWDPITSKDGAFQLGVWCGKQSKKTFNAEPGKTTMIATTYDSDSKQYVVYIDGKEHDKVEGMTFNIHGPKQLLRIAEKPPPHKGEFDFPGQVRDLKFWPRVLAPGEIPTMQMAEAEKEAAAEKDADPDEKPEVVPAEAEKEAAAEKDAIPDKKPEVFPTGWMALCPTPTGA